MKKKELTAVLKALLVHLGLEVLVKECVKCHGLGKWQDGCDCAECDGAGKIYELRKR